MVDLETVADTPAEPNADVEKLKTELKKTKKINTVYLVTLSLTFLIMLMLALFSSTGSDWGQGNGTRVNCSDGQ
jgi:hypothetical protein